MAFTHAQETALAGLGGAFIGYLIARQMQKPTIQTVIRTTRQTVRSTATIRPLIARQLAQMGSWPAPPSPYAEGSVTGLGPGSGNQPNGAYTLAATFNLTSSGSVTLSTLADDWARLYLDGQDIGSVYWTMHPQNTPVSKTLTLSAGSHTLLARVTNNGLGVPAEVAYNSGSPNPTIFTCVITDAAGKTLLTTSSASGWHYADYTHTPQVAFI